jgi:hypothetical protein
MSVGDPIEVAPGSLLSSAINLEAGILGSSQLDVASTAELTMEDYQEPTRDWRRLTSEEMLQEMQ